jgi:hypothetical protein
MLPIDSIQNSIFNRIQKRNMAGGKARSYPLESSRDQRPSWHRLRFRAECRSHRCGQFLHEFGDAGDPGSSARLRADAHQGQTLLVCELRRFAVKVGDVDLVTIPLDIAGWCGQGMVDACCAVGRANVNPLSAQLAGLPAGGCVPQPASPVENLFPYNPTNSNNFARESSITSPSITGSLKGITSLTRSITWRLVLSISGFPNRPEWPRPPGALLAGVGLSGPQRSGWSAEPGLGLQAPPGSIAYPRRVWATNRPDTRII